MTTSEEFAFVARAAASAAASATQTRTSLTSVGIGVDQVLAGTNSGQDHALGRHLAQVHAALSTAGRSLARASEAARQAAIAAAAEEQRDAQTRTAR